MPAPRSSHRTVLDDLLQPVTAEPATRPHPVPAEEAPAPPVPQRERRNLRRLTVNLEADMIELARTVVFHSPGLTLSRLITEALHADIRRREAARGEPFPPSRGSIRTGRPIR
jgi:hypothetical protein